MHYELNPEFRPAYELLIKYNDSIGNRDKQLKYINTLMSLDKNYEKKINKSFAYENTFSRQSGGDWFSENFQLKILPLLNPRQ